MHHLWLLNNILSSLKAKALSAFLSCSH